VTVGNDSEFVTIELPGAAEGSAEDGTLIHDVATVDGEVDAINGLIVGTVPESITSSIFVDLRDGCIGGITASFASINPDQAES